MIEKESSEVAETGQTPNREDTAEEKDSEKLQNVDLFVSQLIEADNGSLVGDTGNRVSYEEFKCEQEYDTRSSVSNNDPEPKETPLTAMQSRL
jgi:hypothetical protein